MHRAFHILAAKNVIVRMIGPVINVCVLVIVAAAFVAFM